MVSVSGRPVWGAETLPLSFPFANVRLKGLSIGQRTTLSNAYSQYLSGSKPELKGAGLGLDCYATRIEPKPEISTPFRTADSQYLPQQVRNPDSIELTGYKFQAQIQLLPSPATSYLGVVEEQEFAESIVIENFLRIFAARAALDQGGVLLHSAGLVFGERAIIFVGRSGAGKTTLATKAYQNGAGVLSDDINLLLPDSGVFRAYPVPFSGEFGRTLVLSGGRESYQISCIVLLEHGKTLRSSLISKGAAVASLLVGCPFVNTDDQESENLFNVLTNIVDNVPVIRLQSRRKDRMEDIMRVVDTRASDG